MGPAIYRLVSDLIVPPGIFLILALAGLVLCRYRPRPGRLVLSASIVLLYLTMTPLVAYRMIIPIEKAGGPALTGARQTKAGAIVILSAGLRPFAPDYGAPTVNEVTLERLRYGARLAHQTGLPVLLTGGPVRGLEITLARAMADALENDFSIHPRWLENRSRTTFENATYSAEILRRAGIKRIILITHAAHMRRSVAVFRAAGLAVVPAPTAFTPPPPDFPYNVIPGWRALRAATYASHEVIGCLWYRLRHSVPCE